jgi:hypothetical protein
MMTYRSIFRVPLVVRVPLPKLLIPVDPPIPDKLEKQLSNFRAKFGMKIFPKYLTPLSDPLEIHENSKINATALLW